MMKALILTLALVASGTASAMFFDRPRRGCDPVWETVVPVYRTVKHRNVVVGYRCVTRQPNGGPSTGGGQAGGG